ncbi:hypothetical protein [Rhizorhabdus dicambivorans]|uniref:Uncharacterized protein n=1 Tax=Rhizorhabdus dicambivorans TaxID=1850238 RepID=A0A2A4FSK5_9SPHN|nr:hypothetical protein [Rhizorhabdus dicambivorans]ATE63842.1 hypothetical protein CMV14_05070 [Rhizorhabdus dicambivorans]PCE40676.1 hypothetical protein COO09_18970 [Rhizorhabdus dicambivorans]
MRPPGSARDEWQAAWPTVVAAAVGQAFCTSHIYSLGLFIAPLEQQFGWSRTQITSGYLLLSAASILCPDDRRPDGSDRPAPHRVDRHSALLLGAG